jgi:SAM-dependent methyltransferase
MNNLDIEDIKEKYKEREHIWSHMDKWHYYQYLTISSFLEKNIKKFSISNDIDIINLGSGGNPYCFGEKNMLHVDIIEKNIVGKPHSLVSNIERLEVSGKSYNCCICVGSVINYTDALKSIKEIDRILKPKGFLFLEFENSKSFEYYGTDIYGKSAAIAETFYLKERERLWVYSETFIKDALTSYNFKILGIKRFHIISPFIYKICHSPTKATQFCKFDNIMSHIPLISNNASNIILIAQKLF